MTPGAFRLALLLVLATTLACTEQERAPGAPVVLISIDTLRSDRLPAYGYAAGRTPAIDRLAADSLLYERAYSNCPLTLPSHASIFTGLVPPLHGVRDNLGFRLDDAHTTLAERLRDAGYESFGVVSSMVLRGSTGIAQGFDVWDDAIGSAHRQRTMAERPGRDAVESAKRWLDARGEPGRPFLLFVHLYEPHAPYEPPPAPENPADPYDGEVAEADRVVGELLGHLRALGLYDDTLIVLLADHGEGLGDHDEIEHGLTLYREALQVPLLVKLPGGRRAGERIAEEVALTDVAPTVLDLLGLPDPGLPGRSVLSRALPARPIYAETLFPFYQYGWSSLRSIVGDGLHWIDGPRPEIFDLRRDPGERDNLFGRRDPPADFVATLAALGEGESSVAEVDADTLRSLASLGYVGGGAAAPGEELDDPRDHVADVEALRAISRWRAGDAPLPDDARIAALLDGIAGNRESSRRAVARALLRSGSPERAYRLLAPLAASEDPETSILLGEVAMTLGRLDEARAAFERALSLDPGHADALTGMGMVWMSLDRLPEARPLLERAVLADPRHSEAWNALGVLRARGGDEAGAVEAWSMAVAADPGLADAWFNLALAHRNANRNDRAAEALERYTALTSGAERARAEALLRTLR